MLVATCNPLPIENIAMSVVKARTFVYLERELKESRTPWTGCDVPSFLKQTFHNLDLTICSYYGVLGAENFY